jgi:hypothetical protein
LFSASRWRSRSFTQRVLWSASRKPSSAAADSLMHIER